MLQVLKLQVKILQLSFLNLLAAYAFCKHLSTQFSKLG